MANRTQPDPDRAAAEFDRWAEDGRGESMAVGHRHGTLATIAGWAFEADSLAVDVGCGNGWAVRLLRERGAPSALGVDVSPAMIARARALTDGDPHQRFAVATGDDLPVGDGAASHLLSVESLYYYPDPAAALAEWARAVRPGGQLGVMIDLYAENPGSHPWIDALDIDVHLLSAGELVDMARAAGWTNATWRQEVDPRPIRSEDAFTPDPYFPSYRRYRQYRELGSLVFTATR